MKKNIQKLCLEQKPNNRSRIDLIQNSIRNEIEQCLQLQECQAWFLDEVFRHRYDNDNTMVQTIVNHPNCPHELLALVFLHRPEWLKNSLAMAELQLSIMEADAERSWKRNLHYAKSTNLPSCALDLLYSEDFRFLSRRYSNNCESENFEFLLGDNSVALHREIFRRIPEFVVASFADKDSMAYIAVCCQLSSLPEFIKKMPPRIQAIAASRGDISNKLIEKFSIDKSVLVRTAIAKNKKTADGILIRLSRDKNHKVANLAIERLPENIRKKVLKQRSSVQNNSNLEQEESQLLVLRLPCVDSTELTQIAAKAKPLLACAAVLHPSASAKVCTSAAARADLPLWAKIGLALKSNNSKVLDTLIYSKNQHIHTALSSNSHLNEKQALELSQESKNHRVLVNIANMFIDNVFVLKKIMLLAPRSAWVTKLKTLLDSDSKAKELLSLHRNYDDRFLVHSRLLARHKNCPKSCYALFSYYLPDDLAKNTTYNLQVLEAGKTIKPQPFDDWKINECLNDGYGHEFLNYKTLHSSDLIADIRKLISCKYTNPNEVRHLVILDDSHTHKRFLHDRALPFSEYEYRIIAQYGSPATQKLLVENIKISDELLLELTESKYKAVSMAAQKAAQNRGLGVSVKIDSSSLKSLGNKAARLDLARETQDINILKMLTKDKTRDVRRTVAYRKELDNLSLIELLADDDASVLSSALNNLGLLQRTLNHTENDRLQEKLKTILLNENIQDYVRIKAFSMSNDKQLKDAQFKNGLGLFDQTIALSTDNETILASILFAYERGDRKFTERTIMLNPYVGWEHKDKILVKRPELAQALFTNILTFKQLLDTYKRYSEGFKKYLISHSFRLGFTLSKSNIEHLYNELDLKTFCFVTEGKLHLLGDSMLISIVNKLSGNPIFDIIFGNNNYSEVVFQCIKDCVFEKKNHQHLSSFVVYYELSTELITELIKNGSKDVKEEIGRNQKLTTLQINLIEKDASFNVRHSLFDSTHVSIEQLSSAFLRAISTLKGSYFKEEAKEELERRGEFLENNTPVPATSALKQCNTSMSVIAFNKFMLEKGFLEVLKRASTSKPGTVKESKRLTKQAKQYGENNLNDYGDYSVVYYPVKFLELLSKLDVKV